MTPAIVSYLPTERLDDLIRATGFDVAYDNWEYKFRWLIERIGMLKTDAEKSYIVHDNPEVEQLVSLVQSERRTIAGLRNTIAGLQMEIEKLRAKKG